MRFRSTVLFAVVLLVLLALAVPAGAAPGPPPSLVLSRARSLMAQRTLRRETAPARAADPIGPFALSGTVLDYDGNPVTEADVLWGWLADDGPSWWEGTYVPGGHTATDDGAFSFPSVTSVPGHDYLSTLYYGDSGFLFLDSYGNDFSTSGPYVIRPGRVRVELEHSVAGERPMVITGDPSSASAETEITTGQGTTTAGAAAPGFVTATVLAQTSRGTAPAAVGWVSPGHVRVPVVAGQEAGESLVFDWKDAVRGHFAGPYTDHSGPPGSRITYVLDDWPAGMRVSFSGTSIDDGSTCTFPQSVTSEGRDRTYRVSLTIPEDAQPGDLYYIDAYRSDDPQALLEVYDYFLVSDFGATRGAIDRGEQVRLHGQCESYQVTLFKRTSPAPRPSEIFPPGWTKVRSFKTYGHGRFRTGFMRPDRTTWYVALFSGGDFPAYTQVVKVAVRNQ